jgi:hypothetical protein
LHRHAKLLPCVSCRRTNLTASPTLNTTFQSQSTETIKQSQSTLRSKSGQSESARQRLFWPESYQCSTSSSSLGLVDALLGGRHSTATRNIQMKLAFKSHQISLENEIPFKRATILSLSIGELEDWNPHCGS